MTAETKRCDMCFGSGHVPSTHLDMNDVGALLVELRDLVNNRQAFGLQTPDLRTRLRAYARVQWLVARMTWLETDAFLAGRRQGAPGDPTDMDRTAVLPAVK